MTELKKLLELNALICEAQAIAIEVDAMKVANSEREMPREAPAYTEESFMQLARETRGIVDKFRKLGGAR